MSYRRYQAKGRTIHRGGYGEAMSKYWFYRWPGMVYAYDIRFENRVPEREVRESLRLRWGFARLPNGAEVWRG